MTRPSTYWRARRAALPLLLLVAACGASLTQIAGYVSTGAAVVCPDLSILPDGSQICTAVAAAVSGFLNMWAATHPSMKAARAAAYDRLTRFGSYGYVPPAVAAELAKPEVSAALDAYVKAALAGAADGGASKDGGQ